MPEVLRAVARAAAFRDANLDSSKKNENLKYLP
jgi:hypothetical protein